MAFRTSLTWPPNFEMSEIYVGHEYQIPEELSTVNDWCMLCYSVLLAHLSTQERDITVVYVIIISIVWKCLS